ncbi:DoxX family protein [Sediminibacterium ginsengisoli]|uniref:Putative oxidoreductase n=1 Tax=Sediminibacterium ginsengisoli TaxID=413434 RepID=A0A1T4RFS6_9BACT|nr:DoxX family protein [Sediminibacterium ginsengisoli]SKA14793.1 putative oxidoreductase [Sediminibacterium ginsengisoli]
MKNGLLTKLFGVRQHAHIVSAALLLLRIGIGAALMFHGWPKIQNPAGWMGPDAGHSAFMQSLAAISEFCGGLALILGLVTPLAAFGIACTMGTAFYMHLVVFKHPFVNLTGGPSFELALAYLLIALLILVAGPGTASLDRAIFGLRGRRNMSY